MPTWFYVALTVINGVSLLGLYLFMRKIKEAIRRQVHVLGKVNEGVVKNRTYYVTVYCYYLAVLAFLIFSYFIFDIDGVF